MSLQAMRKKITVGKISMGLNALGLGSVAWILAFARLSSLGFGPLLDPTEGRYAGIGRRMCLTGQWIMPYLDDGQPFWSKPPLHFWFEAISFRLLGFSEFAARFPSFLSAAFLGGLVYLVTLRLADAKTAAFSSLVFCSTFAVAFFSGVVMTDLTLAAAIGGALACLAFAMEETSAGARRVLEYGFFAFLGLGMMVKGPIALAVGVLAVAFAGFASHSWGALKKMPWGTGLFLAAAIFVPWLVAAEKKTPGFLRYYVLNEHVYRYFRGNYGDRYGAMHGFPYGTIFVFFLASALPWSPLYVVAMWERIRAGWKKKLDGEKVVQGWAVANLAFFALCRNVVPAYVLPGLAANAILAGIYRRHHASQARRQEPLVLGLNLFLGAGAILGLSLLRVRYGLPGAWFGLGIASIAVWALLASVPRDEAGRWARNALLVPMLCVALAVFSAVSIGRYRSTRELIERAKLVAGSWQPEDLVYFDTAPASAGYYLPRPPRNLYRSIEKTDRLLENGYSKLLVVSDEDLKELYPRIRSRTRLLFKSGASSVFLVSPSGD